MELLIIKIGTNYIRFKENGYYAVGLDKASVYPFDRLEQVRQQLADVRAGGFPQAAIYRLTLTEVPLSEALP